ncbi:MAG: hypothetical protein EAZ25_02145 [Oscillatoriales cyanobacterium]|nr:MAG: hypothetical protein EAZ25_02145 [Oscillatoriales cyanobacterium]TAH30620.1 MAG: hypothetical protein EAZ10_02680 [Oscillatoriales cyanobacterium]
MGWASRPSRKNGLSRPSHKNNKNCKLFNSHSLARASPLANVNFPNQDLSVLVYAPDKKLILTAKYDQQSNQIEDKS